MHNWTKLNIVELELTYSGIISFLKEERFSSADAQLLGVHLNIPQPTMNTLTKNNVGNADGLLYDVIDSWLNFTDPTAEELAKALDNSDCKRIADRIRGK